jgi:OmpA-OmpF porin, OOP family
MVFVATGLGASLSPRSAGAQTLPSVDVRTWTPSTDHRAGLVTEPTTTPGPWAWNVGAWFHYTHQPVTLRRTGSDDVALRPIEAQVGANVTAGLGIGSRAAIGLDVPFVLYQGGSSGLPRTVSSVDSAPSTALGDIGIHGKGAIISNEAGGFGLAVLGGLTLPTGERTSFIGDGSTRATARLLAEYSLVLASVQGSLGYALRTEHHTWPESRAGGVTFGDDIPWSFGFNVKPGVFKMDEGNRQVWELGLHGSLPAGPVGPFGSGDPGSARLSPMLLAASDRVALGHYRDTYFLGGAEVGLTTAVGTPAFRVVAAIGWAPREHDQDHDGVADDLDQCPEIPEDRDGFEDSDGCPEIDNDDDGVVDAEDKCPKVQGVAPNGCPATDADADGIPDNADACPKAAGPLSDDPKASGCPIGDRDGDGIIDTADKCPDQAEDKDGFEDEDGCPDPDDDGDGVTDKLDACPRVAGEPSTDPARNGCVSPDRDGDTIDNAADQCPDVPEVFNGLKDDDGCPDEGGKPLVVIDPKDPRLVIKLATPIKLTGPVDAPVIDPASLPTLRALVLELNRHRDWALAVGARPAAGQKPGAEADKSALGRALAVAGAVGQLAHRDDAAETVSWDAVKKQPGAEASGVGLVILSAAITEPKAATPPAPAPKPTTATPPAPAPAPAATPKPSTTTAPTTTTAPPKPKPIAPTPKPSDEPWGPLAPPK